MIMAVIMVISLVVVVFIIVIFVFVVFAIAHCHNMLNIVLHWATAAEAHSLYQLKTSDVINKLRFLHLQTIG